MMLFHAFDVDTTAVSYYRVVACTCILLTTVVGIVVDYDLRRKVLFFSVLEKKWCYSAQSVGLHSALASVYECALASFKVVESFQSNFYLSVQVLLLPTCDLSQHSGHSLGPLSNSS